MLRKGATKLPDFDANGHEPFDVLLGIALAPHRLDVELLEAVLDPVEGLTSSDPDADYLSLMRKNLRALRLAGGCS